jgi:hypothetical protein
MAEHERPVEPFADLHFEDDRVRATLLHDPTVEGLDMAMYIDGSGSMQDEYQPREKTTFLSWLLGLPGERLPSQVEPQVQWMLEYLATKDRNGVLRVAYWACGAGDSVEVVGELKGVDVEKYKFPGPKRFGKSTRLAPAIRDYVNYIMEQARNGASRIAKGNLPRVNFVLVGVGDEVNEEQLEQICHEEYPGIGHLWCHRIAEEIRQVAELVAVLVDETMTVAAGGTIYDDKGRVVKVYEGRLPAVLEFDVPEGTTSFTLEVSGKRYTQPLPEEEHH